MRSYSLYGGTNLGNAGVHLSQLGGGRASSCSWNKYLPLRVLLLPISGQKEINLTGGPGLSAEALCQQGAVPTGQRQLLVPALGHSWTYQEHISSPSWEAYATVSAKTGWLSTVLLYNRVFLADLLPNSEV